MSPHHVRRQWRWQYDNTVQEPAQTRACAHAIHSECVWQRRLRGGTARLGNIAHLSEVADAEAWDIDCVLSQHSYQM